MGKFKKIAINIAIVLVILTALFFTGYGIGSHRTNEQWTDKYNTFRDTTEAELLGARNTIAELEGTSREYGIITNQLRSENTELRDEVGILKSELEQLRAIESATRDIYRKLGTILESDRELIDKIIDVARTLQSAIIGVEEGNN